MKASQSVEDVVESYCKNWRPLARKEERHFQRLPSLHEAIDQAARGIDPRGKRHPHQRFIPRESLAESREILLSLDLGCCQSFEELHELVRKAISPVHRIGPLTVYDIAHRIGGYMRLEPEYVYLHRGTADGARAIGFAVKRTTVGMSELPHAFQRLRPHEAEDCLCLYKDELAAIYRR